MITKAGTVVAGLAALYNLNSFKSKYDLLNTKNEELRSELRTLEKVRDGNTRKVTTLKEKKKLLNVTNVQ